MTKSTLRTCPGIWCRFQIYNQNNATSRYPQSRVTTRSLNFGSIMSNGSPTRTNRTDPIVESWPSSEPGNPNMHPEHFSTLRRVRDPMVKIILFWVLSKWRNSFSLSFSLIHIQIHQINCVIRIKEWYQALRLFTQQRPSVRWTCQSNAVSETELSTSLLTTYVKSDKVLRLWWKSIHVHRKDTKKWMYGIWWAYETHYRCTGNIYEQKLRVNRASLCIFGSRQPTRSCEGVENRNFFLDGRYLNIPFSSG